MYVVMSRECTVPRKTEQQCSCNPC